MDDLVGALRALKGKRVLITGDTGFKGSWLALWLSNAGANVYGYALPCVREDDHFNLLALAGKIHHRDGDIRDRMAIGDFFAEARPEVVFHLAAQALVRRSYRDPKETFDTNVGGSVNVLECVRERPEVQTLLYITSDKCYRNKEWLWGYRENDELGGHDPYSASKASAELLFSAYADSFFEARAGFGFASVRAGNVIGGGDWSEDRIVPDCVRALGGEQPIVLRRPAATRPWQHVLEPLAGYVSLAGALQRSPKEFSGSWNFGPDSSAQRTVRDLAERIVSAWGSGSVEERSSGDEPHEAGLLSLNCDKARHLLGWRARWGFERTVDETIGWYKDVRAGSSIEEVSLRQIRSYLDTTND